ncbi:hypothetical protein NDU88_001685 [Pleurodeles waltl]|uniref:Uncharacterized protein n=1 Tax=Pleurodeles waltl TaxID=8319 RepID=A0AAV7WJ24_PLEWA|nr:hypothetical protein NDU88_001685 [Pleurodeles waltl]
MEPSVRGGGACCQGAAGLQDGDVPSACVKHDALFVSQEHEDLSSTVKLRQEATGISLEAFNLQIQELEKSELKLRETLQNYMKSDPVLRTRIKELELSEKKLLERVEQMTGDMHFLENVNVRIKCRLQDIQVELQEANEGKEKLERTHKEKVRRLQDHLRMKEGEIKSYLEYFEHYKEKRRQQMRMLREREHRLQNQVLKLEKEIVDCNAMPPFLNTVEDPSNDEGVEQSIETDTFQNHTRLPGTEEEREEAKIYNEDGAHHLTKQIQKLQNDLKSLLEREVVNNGEREELINRLQKSEDNEDFLNRKLEEFRCRISELKMTEYNLQQFVEDLEEENKRLKNELKVSSHKEEENPHLVAEECKMHNIPDINLVSKRNMYIIERLKLHGYCITADCMVR